MYAIQSRMTGEWLYDGNGRLCNFHNPDNAGYYLHHYTKFPAEWEIIYIG